MSVFVLLLPHRTWSKSQATWFDLERFQRLSLFAMIHLHHGTLGEAQILATSKLA